MPIFVGHDSARTLEDVTPNNNHTRMVHGDPFAIYTKAASGYVGFAPGIRCEALSDALPEEHTNTSFGRKQFTDQGEFLNAVGR